MRVPFRRQPETRISEQQQAYARPVQPLNVEPITRLVEGFRDQMLDEQDARQRIDLSRRLIAEVNELQPDFEARRRDPDISPDQFAANINTLYTDRHNVLLEELRGQHYSQDLLDDFDTRLGAVRQGFVERALAHQLEQLTVRAGERAEDTGRQVSQYVAADPVHNYETGVGMLRDTILSDPDLLESQREQLLDEQLAVARDGGSRAYALQHPEEVIRHLDPQGLTAPNPPATGTAPTAGEPAGNPATWRTTPPPEDAGDNPPHFEAAGLTWRDAGAANRRGTRHGGTMGAVDIAGPRGTPLQITRAFEVVRSGPGSNTAAGRRAGNITRIRFPDGAEFDAMHLDDLPAARRYAAGEGTAVLRTGTSGNAAENDPHIHLQAANDKARSLLTQGRRYLAAYLQGGPGLPPEQTAAASDSHFNDRSLPRGVRNNNPGNLMDGQFTRSRPGYRGSDGHFSQFNTMEDGIAAQEELLRRRLNQGRSITTLIRGTGRGDGFAPSQQDGGDNPEASVQHYIEYLSRRLGRDPNAQLSAADVPRLGEAIRDMEARGWRDHLGRAAPAAAQASDPAPVAAPQVGEQTASATAAPAPGQPPVRADASDIASVRTGIPLIDDLSGPERMILLGRAREQLTRIQAAQRAEMDVRLGNITAEYLQNGGESATPAPTEQEVLRAYPGPEGPQRWAQLQQTQRVGRSIVTFRTQSAEAMQAELDRLLPTRGSPTYAAQLQIYRAAEQARDTLLAARQRDPAAYVMQYFPSVRQAAQQGTAQYYAALDRAYQALGIDTRTAPVMTSEAAQQLTRDYRLMQPVQRARFLEDNMEEMGEARFRRFVSGMEGTTAEVDADIYALLRHHPGAGVARNLLNEILEGREIIAQDPAKRPRAAEVTEIFRRVGLHAIRDLDPRTSAAIQSAAEGLYARRGGDPVHINRTLYEEALTAVLGGNLPANMTRGRATDYTILPPRVTERQFRTWMEGLTIPALTNFSLERQAPLFGDLRTQVPIQTIIDEGVFVMVSPGWYAIRMASDGRPLMTRSGNRFLMRINPQGLMNNRAAPRATQQAPRPMSGGVM